MPSAFTDRVQTANIAWSGQKRKRFSRSPIDGAQHLGKRTIPVPPYEHLIKDCAPLSGAETRAPPESLFKQ